MENPLESVSEAFQELVQNGSRGVLHLYAEGAQGRTAVRIGGDEAVSVAMDASISEEVSLLDVEGNGGTAEVAGYDQTTGIVLLSLKGQLSGSPLDIAETESSVGSLGVTVAYPSPQGVEARLEMVRCVAGPLRLPAGGTMSRYMQSDALSYPGFLGAPLLSSAGRIAALALPSGRRGDNLFIPGRELSAAVEALRSTPRISVAYLGVRGQEARLPEPIGTRTEGFLVTNVESGSPAADAGVRVGDFLLSLGEKEVASSQGLFEALIGDPQRQSSLTLLRGREEKKAAVQLRQRRGR